MMRLRQIALVAKELDRAIADLRSVFGLGEPFHDPGVGVFGLDNAVFAIGSTFLEVVSPLRDDASAARYLARKGGDAGYMVIVQSDDLDRERRRLSDLQVRIVFETALGDIATLHLHPHDIGGAIVSIDAAVPWESWRWAGPGWETRGRLDHVHGITGVEVACVDPVRTAERWAEVLGRAQPETRGRDLAISLEEGVLVFVRCEGTAEEGVASITLDVAAKEPLLRNARMRGLPVDGDSVRICGTRVRLSP